MRKFIKKIWVLVGFPEIVWKYARMHVYKYFESKHFWPKSYPAQTFSNWAYLAACASSELLRACVWSGHVSISLWLNVSNVISLKGPASSIPRSIWKVMVGQGEDQSTACDIGSHQSLFLHLVEHLVSCPSCVAGSTAWVLLGNTV